MLYLTQLCATFLFHPDSHWAGFARLSADGTPQFRALQFLADSAFSAAAKAYQGVKRCR